MRIGHFRVKRDGAAVGRHRFGMQALPMQRYAQIMVCAGIVSHCSRQAQALGRFGQPAEAQQRLAARMMRGRVPGIEFDGAAEGGNGGGQLAGIEKPNPSLALPPGGVAPSGRVRVPGTQRAPFRNVRNRRGGLSAQELFGALT
jgi:hypothetical protein